ncbi:O-antigen/teichoic acid export membrane protein [Pseudonocardia sediminis]|uniref:O-antigen/teichoic acid export membrane protein n=1 Tax=Pseudonocardia sediminis TaxID=1397368 RepID=A0A4Q7UPD8_PSEST|nr:lipopolysaccharide biosynthesis protein [Pseudonocardia sediminis]RZT83366.1 O-antigen/teichoic acid export membrane protein [Pseudonocardia sediminis]
MTDPHTPATTPLPAQPNAGDGAASAAGASKDVLGRGSLYTIASAAPILAAVLVTPFVTRLLGAAEYGVVAIALQVVQVGAMVGGLGMAASITRHGIMERSGADGARALVLRGSAISTALLVIAMLAGPLWGEPVLGTPWRAGLAFAVIAAAGFGTMLNAQSFLRVLDRPVPFVALSTVATLGGPAIGLLLVLFRGSDANDYLFGLMAGYLLAGIGGIALSLRGGRPRGEPGDFSHALKVGLPAVPHLVALFLAQGALVLVAARYLGTAAGGRLQIALLIGGAPAMITSALNNAWAPVIYRTSAEHRGAALESTAKDVAGVTAVLAGGVALLSPWVLQILAPASFGPSELVVAVGITTVGSVISVAYLANVHLVFASSRSTGLAFASPISLAVGVLISLGVAQVGGLTAVAAGFPITYLCLAIGTALLRRRVSPTSWREAVLTGPVLGGIVICGLGATLPFTGALWITVRLVLAVALGGLFLLLVRRIFTR